MSLSRESVPLDRVLEHAGWARAIAYSLVHDRNLGDDLVQEVILRALRSPPPAGTAIRGWIYTVLRNLVTSGWRAETSRRRREAAVAPRAPVPSPSEIAERIDLHRRIGDAVAGLEPELAQVVYLRYHEALLPNEIASRLGIAVPTVHARLRRAIERLRFRLRGEAERSGLALPVFLGPLLAGLPDPADLVGPTTGRPEPGPPRAARRVPRAALLAAGAAVTALLLAARFAASPEAPPAVSANAKDLRADGVADAGRSRRAAASSRDGAPGPATGPEASPAVEGAALPREPLRPVSVRLVGAPADRPVRVRWTPILADPSATAAPPRIAEARGGALVLDTAGLGSTENPLCALDVVPDDPDCLPRTVRVPVVRAAAPAPEFPLVLDAAAAVTGRALAESGGARVQVGAFRFSGPRGHGTEVDRAEASSDGTFRIRAAPAEETWIVVAADDHVPRAFPVRTSGPLDLGEITLSRGLDVTGRVRMADGSAAPPGAAIRVGSPASAERRVTLGDRVVGIDGEHAAWDYLTRPVAPDGRFRIGGLVPGDVKVDLTGVGVAGDLVPSTDRVVRTPADGLDFEVAGSPIDVIVPAEARGARVLVVDHGAPPTVGVRVVDGHARVLGTPALRYEFSLVVPPDERWVGVAEPAAPGATRTVVMRRESRDPSSERVARVEFRVPPDSGVRGIHVEVHAGNTGPSLPLLRTHLDVAGGSATLDVAATGEHRFRVVPWRASPSLADFLAEETVDLDLRPGEPRTVDLRPRLGGRVRLLVRGPGGRAESGTFRVLRDGGDVAALAVSRMPGSRPARSSALDAAGATEVHPALAPGDYEVVVTATDGRRASARASVVAGEETLVEVVLP